AKCGSCGCDTGSGYKAQDATQITKCEWSNKPPLKQPGRQDGLTSIAKALEGRGPKTSVAHEIGGDGANHHAEHKRWTDAPTECDKDPRGDTRGGPEHGHVRGLGDQGKPQLRCLKIGDGDSAGRNPRPCCPSGEPEIPIYSVESAPCLQRHPRNTMALIILLLGLTRLSIR